MNDFTRRLFLKIMGWFCIGVTTDTTVNAKIHRPYIPPVVPEPVYETLKEPLFRVYQSNHLDKHDGGTTRMRLNTTVCATFPPHWNKKEICQFLKPHVQKFPYALRESINIVSYLRFSKRAENFEDIHSSQEKTKGSNPSMHVFHVEIVDYVELRYGETWGGYLRSIGKPIEA